MERNSSSTLRAPGAFGAIGTSDPHATLSSCSLLVHHARLLAHSTAGDAASGRAGASGASCTFLSMQVCCRSGASHARLLARSGAAAIGRSTSGGMGAWGGRDSAALGPGSAPARRHGAPKGTHVRRRGCCELIICVAMVLYRNENAAFNFERAPSGPLAMA